MMVCVAGDPAQPLRYGVMVMMPIRFEVLVFCPAIKGGGTPDPLAPKPIAVLLLLQEYVTPVEGVLVKTGEGTVLPGQKGGGEVTETEGKGETKTVKVALALQPVPAVSASETV